MIYLMKEVLAAGSGNLISDTTGVGTIFKVDVTTLSPASTPGVTNNPITSRVRAISNQLNGVINVLSTLASSENTTLIVLPLRSITANGQRRAGKIVVHGSFISRNRSDSRNSQVGARRALVRHALLVLANIRIAARGIKSSLLYNPA
jgi:hypothetical protein